MGCPLPPVLFTCIIELLANAISKDKGISGIGCKEKQNKTNLLADDRLIIINDPLRVYGED